MRLLTRVIPTLMLAGLLAGCGGAPVAVSKVSVDATEFAFAPAALAATAGQALEVTIVNKGIIEHDFTIDAIELKAFAAIGKTATATTASPLVAGTYAFYCSVAGHKEAGMTGTLTVK